MPFMDTATSMVAALGDIIEEDLGDSVFDSLPKLDGAAMDIFTTSEGVSKGIGRDFKKIMVFETGVTGATKWVNPLGTGIHDFEGAANDGQSIMTNQTTPYLEWPGAEQSPLPGFFRREVSLARMLDTISVPIEYFTAGELDATITDIFALIQKRAAQNIALAKLNCFYSTSIHQDIGTVGAVTFQNHNGTEDQATIILSSGSPRNYYAGMFIEVFAPISGVTLGAKRHTSRLIVKSVRYIPLSSDAGYGSIVVQSVPNEDLNQTLPAAITSGDVILREETSTAAGTAGRGFIGPDMWLANSGIVFGADVDRFQQLQSVVEALGGAVLSEQIFSKFAGRYRKAYGMENMPETILSSVGAQNAYVENSDGLGRFDRTGQTFVIAGGYETGSTPFLFAGQPMKWTVSDMMPSLSAMNAASQVGGRVWFLKMRDGNIQRLQPPKTRGSGSNGPFGMEVEFPFGNRHSHGIFQPTKASSGRQANYVEANAQIHTSIMPKWLPGIKLTGVAETL